MRRLLSLICRSTTLPISALTPLAIPITSRLYLTSLSSAGWAEAPDSANRSVGSLMSDSDWAAPVALSIALRTAATFRLASFSAAAISD